jgi:4-amino-4-deoxy-L-arabinose transferase-like glycosyltransferase
VAEEASHAHRMTQRWPALLTLSAIAVYLAVSLTHLTVFPPVGEDEPWIAAAPAKLATQGVFGSDLFAGYYGSERHHYEHLPLYPLAQAAVFRLFGVGTFQMRLLPVACGLLLLLLTFTIGRLIGDERIGALAVVVMVFLRVSEGPAGTGILLLDRARINRYDIAVPVLGLAALRAFLEAERTRSPRWYGAAGALAGLSSLAHLYGAFWLVVFVGLLWIGRGPRFVREPASWTLLAAFLTTWLPWLAYILSGWSDYLGQTRAVADRFDLLNPAFYAGNVLSEMERYRFIDIRDGSGSLKLARPGTWTLLAGIPAALAAMTWQSRPRTVVFALAFAAIVQAALFALLVSVKAERYLIAIWPLGAIALAWLAIELWNRSSALLRIGLASLLLLVVAEGAGRIFVRLVHEADCGVHPCRLARSRIPALLDGPAGVSLSHLAASPELCRPGQLPRGDRLRRRDRAGRSGRPAGRSPYVGPPREHEGARSPASPDPRGLRGVHEPSPP